MPARLAGMRGTDVNDGKSLAGIEHLRQSVRDILTTPIGSRVMRRTYGSQLFALTDAPLNRSALMDLVAATSDALNRWEPRFRLLNVQAAMPAPGQVVLTVTGRYLPEGRVVVLDGIEVR